MSTLTTIILPYLTGLDNHLSNICRRGEVGGSAKKTGKRIQELDRIYENTRGGDRKSNPNNYGLMSHDKMANLMGISVSTLENYKMLADMIPKLNLAHSKTSGKRYFVSLAFECDQPGHNTTKNISAPKCDYISIKIGRASCRERV